MHFFKHQNPNFKLFCSLPPPATLISMVWRDNELARRDALAHLVVRPDAQPLRIELSALATADAHTLDVRWTASVRCINRSADIQLLQEQFAQALDAAWGTVCTHDVEQSLLQPLHESMSAFCRQHDVAVCLKQSNTVATLLLSRANEVGFACGLVFEAPARVVLHSNTLAAAEMQAQLHREKTAETNRTVEHLQAIQRLPVEHRPVHNHLHFMTDAFAHVAPARVFIVAGPTLAQVDFSHKKLLCIPLNDVDSQTSVPLRSVRILSDQRLALGHAGGVYLYDLQTSFNVQSPVKISATKIAVNDVFDRHAVRGVNGATLAAEGSIIFSHGELGIFCYDSAGHTSRIAINTNVRHLTTIGHRTFFVIGTDVFFIQNKKQQHIATGTHNIVAILQLAGRWIVVRSNGDITFFDTQTLQAVHHFSVEQSVRSAATISCAHLDALVIGCETNQVQIISQSGELLWHQALPETPVMLAATGPYILATGTSRERIYVINIASIERDMFTLHALAVANHRVMDIAAEARPTAGAVAGNAGSSNAIIRRQAEARVGDVVNNVTPG
jgi:hypothetical protein